MVRRTSRRHIWARSFASKAPARCANIARDLRALIELVNVQVIRQNLARLEAVEHE